MTLVGWFFHPTNQIERIVFEDGTVWAPAETESLRYFGTAGDDFIQTTDHGERIEGRGGNDVLLGGMGDDVYVSVFGGFDYIQDFAGLDELQMGSGISPDQVQRVRLNGSDDLILRVAGTGDQVTLVGWFFHPTNQIERVVFEDDTVWAPAETESLRYFGTAGDDFIQTTDHGERIEGRGGNDVLLGGIGDDVYVSVFGGFDYIQDFAGLDELQMGPGVSPDQVQRVRLNGSDDLILRVAGTGDQVTLARLVLQSDQSDRAGSVRRRHGVARRSARRRYAVRDRRR